LREGLGTFLLVFAVVTGLVTAVAAVNVAFDLHLAFGVRGASKTELPDEWVAVLGLGVVAAFTGALGGVLSSERLAGFYRRRRAARYATLILVPLVVYVAYVRISYWSYGGKLPWAAAHGKQDVVTEMIAAGDYTPALIDRAWREAVEAKQTRVLSTLAPLVVAEGDVCKAMWVSVDRIERVQILLSAGAKPAACNGRVDLLFRIAIARGEGYLDVVRLLLGHGVRPGPDAMSTTAEIHDQALLELLTSVEPWQRP
jgi:hypothetical protein